VIPLILIAALAGVSFYLYRQASAPSAEKPPLHDLSNEDIKKGWRELGFFCELDNQNRVWTLTGSRAGLLHFPDLLRGFIIDPANVSDGAQQHYGPYGSLEIMTYADAGLTGNAIRGSLTDLDRLASIVETHLVVAEPGAQIRIREEYAPESRYALVLDVRADGFDPSSTDSERLGSTAERGAIKRTST
jgi:hypothetical protein